MNIAPLIDTYFMIEKVIYEFFGYAQQWHAYPLEDMRDAYWMTVHMIDLPDGSQEGVLVHSPEPFTPASILDGKKIYSGAIHPQKIKRAGGLVLIKNDTQCDRNEFLTILDESKECKDETIKVMYTENW